MKKNRFIKGMLGMSLASLLIGFAGTASASGFQLFQYNGSSVGDVNAGAGASALDASTNFTNSAGLVRIKSRQIVVSVNQVIARSQFTGTVTGGGSGTATSSGSTTIPSFHYAMPIDDKWFFGFSVTSPFGSSTNYPIDGIQRFSATETSIKTINISPSIAYKVTDKFSVGFGVDIMKMDATLSQVVSTTAGQIVNEASGWGYGYHVGALYQFTPGTRVGLQYRSQVSQSLSGTSKVSNLGLYSGSATTGIKLPPMITLGVHHDITSKWSVMGSLNYTQWSTVDTITLRGLALPPPNNVSSLPQNFRNTWRASVGTSYELNDKWLLRAGVGYDQTPTNNTDRTVRLPENNRWLVGIGARYRITKKLSIDAGWTRAFIKDGAINNTTGSVTTTGNVKNTADIVGLQLTWDF